MKVGELITALGDFPENAEIEQINFVVNSNTSVSIHVAGTDPALGWMAEGPANKWRWMQVSKTVDGGIVMQPVARQESAMMVDARREARDNQIRCLRRERHLSYRRIGVEFGLSGERVRQIIKQRAYWPGLPSVFWSQPDTSTDAWWLDRLPNLEMG